MFATKNMHPVLDCLTGIAKNEPVPVILNEYPLMQNVWYFNRHNPSLWCRRVCAGLGGWEKGA